MCLNLNHMSTHGGPIFTDNYLHFFICSPGQVSMLTSKVKEHTSVFAVVVICLGKCSTMILIVLFSRLFCM